MAAVVACALCGCSGSNGKSHQSARRTTPSSTATSSTTARGRHNSSDATPHLGQRYEPSLPVALQEGAAAFANGRLYVIGGYDKSRNSSNDVFFFDGTRWQAGPSLPIQVNHPAAAAIGGKIYVAGGFTPDGTTGRAFVLKPRSTSWQEIAPLHRARGALALVSFRSHLYAIGGRAGSVEVGVPETYDPHANAWMDLPAMTDARNHLAGYVDHSNICVAGGRTPDTSARVDCFDPATGKWKQRATLPTATSGAAAAVLAGTTVVAGGEPAGETSIVGSVQMWRGGHWLNVPMLVPRHGTAFARYKGRLWLCGGATAPGFAAVTTCTSLGTT